MAVKRAAPNRKRGARATTQFVEVTERNAIAIVILNRPDVHNAFNAQVIAELTATFAALVVQLSLQLVAGITGDSALAQTTAAGVVGTVSAIVVWVAVGLTPGRSIGGLCVMLRYQGGPLPSWIARPLRMAGAVVGYTVLDALPDPWSLLGGIFLLAAFVLFFATKNGRGLPGVLSGQYQVDAREDAETTAAGSSDRLT